MLEATIDHGLFHPITFKRLVSTFPAPFLILRLNMFMVISVSPLVTH